MLKGTIEKQNDNINNLNVAKQTETKKTRWDNQHYE